MTLSDLGYVVIHQCRLFSLRSTSHASWILIKWDNVELFIFETLSFNYFMCGSFGFRFRVISSSGSDWVELISGHSGFRSLTFLFSSSRFLGQGQFLTSQVMVLNCGSSYGGKTRILEGRLR